MSGRRLLLGITQTLLFAACAATILWVTPPSQPVFIRVRWTPSVSDAERRSLESRFDLTEGRAEEGTTWSYTLLDDSESNIRTLIKDPGVADTHNLNRATFEPIDPPRPRSRFGSAVMISLAASALIVLWSARIDLRTYWLVMGAGWATTAVCALIWTATFGSFLAGRLMPILLALFLVPLAFAIRTELPVSERSTTRTLLAPPALLLAMLAATLVAAGIGFHPFWRDATGVTLIEAASEGDRAIVLRLIQTELDPHRTGPLSDSDQKLLDAAVRSGDVATVRLVVAAMPAIDDSTRSRLISLAERSRSDSVADYLRK